MSTRRAIKRFCIWRYPLQSVAFREVQIEVYPAICRGNRQDFVRNVRIVLVLSVACGTLDGRTQLGQAEPNAEYGVVARRQGVSTPVRSVETIDHASGRRS